jgi:pimeloyl-ACP methyl ester carboxylesterase
MLLPTFEGAMKRMMEGTHMPEATLHDGSTIEIEIAGSGPSLLLPVNPQPVTGPQAEAMQQWGADPALGHSLIVGLRDVFRVVAFDYEGHLQRAPQPDSLTPANAVSDLLTIADAAGAERFAYYGYSWLALIGLQLAIRTDRLTALVMGGWPPLNGPYAAMLRVTMTAHEMAVAAVAKTDKGAVDQQPAIESGDWSNVQVTSSPDQTRQFVTLYQALQGFDDHVAQGHITCPRLCFVGSEDEIQYGPKWGDVLISIAGPIIAGRAELESLGWEVRVLEGLDHLQAMQAKHVLPILRSRLTSQLRP